MLLITKYSNEVSFIDMVTIPIQLNNFKCRRFIWTPFIPRERNSPKSKGHARRLFSEVMKEQLKVVQLKKWG